jgi:hypothetical protein
MAAALKKGALVRALAAEMAQSEAAQASDARLPQYLFTTVGQVVDLKGDYALVCWPVPTPNVWLKLDCLEAA